MFGAAALLATDGNDFKTVRAAALIPILVKNARRL
jgi:hypothetical protein